MSFKRVLLLNFPKIAIEAPPLAPAILSAICKKNNIDYEFIDCNLEFWQQLNGPLQDEILNFFAEHLTDTLSDSAQKWLDQYFDQLVEKSKKFDLVAISVFSNHSTELTREFLTKHRHKIQADILIGGAGIIHDVYVDKISVPKKLYQFLFDEKLIDYWILGEGEIGFEDVILKRLPSSSVNNVIFNHLENFDLVPLPNLDKFQLDQYSPNRKIIGIEGSRGCVKNCTFCDIRATWGTYKFKDGIQLADELLQLKKIYNIDHFWFNDSLINGSMKAFRGFINHLAQNNHQNFTWSSQAIVRARSSRDEEDFKILKASGCETLVLGIESFSQSVRFHMDKKFTDDDLENYLNLAQKYNISLIILLIVGYPTETDRDFDISLAQLEKYQHLADDGTISALRIGGTMSMNSNIPLYNMIDELGIKYTDNSKYKHITWICGDNDLKKRVQWRVAIEDHARSLGYYCLDNEMNIENTLLQFLDIDKNESIANRSYTFQ